MRYLPTAFALALFCCTDSASDYVRLGTASDLHVESAAMQMIVTPHG